MFDEFVEIVLDRGTLLGFGGRVVGVELGEGRDVEKEEDCSCRE